MEEMIKDYSILKTLNMIIYHIVSDIKQRIFHIFFYGMMISELLVKSLFLKRQMLLFY